MKKQRSRAMRAALARLLAMFSRRRCSGLIFTTESDEMSSYIRIPSGFVIAVNGSDYTVARVTDEGIHADPGICECTADGSVLLNWLDIESLHIY